MNKPLSHRVILRVLAFSVLSVCTQHARADEIGGTITKTWTIANDSELVGDVTCAVSGAPCIAFGASGIKLRLNGFTISGSDTVCTAAVTTDGIDATGTAAMPIENVAILGPGIVQKFKVFGIALRHATRVRVEGVTATDNCFSGIFLTGTTYTDIEKNLSVRNAMHSGGNPCGGTWLAGSSHNRVRLNKYFGNGAGLSASPTGHSNNFGVGLIFGSNDNLVEQNKIGGNLNGVYIDSNGDTGNVIRRNLIAGNPPAQVSTEFGASIGADIQDLSTAGTNTFEDNRCLTYAGSLIPAPCPKISNDDNDEDRQERGIAAFGRNRLIFPQARLINAVFHVSPRLLTAAARTAAPEPNVDSDIVTVTGKVVDAACFMLHPPAATAASHMDCGAACLSRGVPLAIATDNGTLYFPADGNTRLKSLLNAHVRASGTVVEKHDPMELKMPVGDKNQMVVRVEGGYKQITIQSLEKVPVAKRPPA